MPLREEFLRSLERMLLLDFGDVNWELPHYPSGVVLNEGLDDIRWKLRNDFNFLDG